MGVLVALSTMAAPQMGQRTRKALHRSQAPTEFVRKAPAKAPAQLNGETRTVEGNDLFVVPDEWFDLYMAFADYGVLDFEGGFAVGQYGVSGYLYVYDEDPAKWYGDFDPEDVELVVYDNSDPADEGTDLTVTSFKYEKTAKGDKMTGVATDKSGNTYNINLTFFAPEKANDTIQIVFEKEAYMSRESGLYYYSDNDKYAAQLLINTTKLEGSFVDADFNKQYTGVFTISGKDTVFTGVPFSAKADIKLQDGIYNISAELFSSYDSVLYQISMKYAKPTAKTTVQVNLDNALLEDETADYGYADMEAAPADSSYILSLSVNTDKLVGSYTDADLDLYYSFVKIGTQYYDIFEASFTVAANADGTYTYTGWLLATNSVKYEFVIKTAVNQAIDELRDGAKATKRLENGRLVIEKNGVKYDAVGTRTW